MEANLFAMFSSVVGGILIKGCAIAAGLPEANPTGADWPKRAWSHLSF